MASIASLVNPTNGHSPPTDSQHLPGPSQAYQLSTPTQSSTGTPRNGPHTQDVNMASEDSTIVPDDEDDVDPDMAFDDEDDDVDGEEALQVEGEGEEQEEEEEEDDDEEEDDEESDEDDDARSEDLEGDGPRSDLPVDPVDNTALAEEAKESSGEATAPAAGEEVVNKPPVKKKRPRAASVDEMPPPPPPMRTIRVDREFDNDDTMEWNILDDARERGMVAEWPPTVDITTPLDTDKPVAGPSQPADPSIPPSILGSNLMEDDAEAIAARLEAKYGGPPKKAKRKAKKEDYDLADEFIDDSELAIDAPTHIGRTKKEGFFIQQGPVELIMEDAAVKRAPPRRPKASDPARLPTLLERVLARHKANEKANGIGTSSSPINLEDDELAVPETIPPLDNSPDPSPSAQHVIVDRGKYQFASKDPTELPPFAVFPKGLARELNKLRQMSEEWTWKPSERSKFPEHLKPQIVNVARAAWENDWWAAFPPKSDANWIKLQFALPSCLPYNKVTLTKLMVTTAAPHYRNFTAECEEVGLEALRAAAKEGAADYIAKREAQKQEYQAQLEAWEATKPGLQGGTKLHDASSISAPGSPQIDGEANPPNDGRPQPKRSLQLPASIRDIYIQLLENNLQEVEFANHGNSLSHSIAPLAEKDHRKPLYLKVMAALPREMEITEKSLSTIMSRWKLRRGTGENANGPPVPV